MRYLAGVLAVVVMVLTAGTAGAVTARPRVIAAVTDATPIAAAGGWVAWSEPVAAGRRLVTWHAGVIQRPAIPPVPAPFDLDLGTDARGRTVATFSRCAASGAECRVRVVDLASGAERAAGMNHPAGSSDTHASMWRGRVAFARSDTARRRNVDQVLLWTPGSPSLKVLPHGFVPAACRVGAQPYDCPTGGVTGHVTSLDLGSRLVAFTWTFDDYYWSYNYEIRAVDLRTGARHLIGRGSTSTEYCTDESEVFWRTPTSDGTRAWFTQQTGRCSRFTPGVVRFGTAPTSWHEGRLPSGTSEAIWDDGVLYALTVPRPQDGPGDTPPCSGPGEPCAIRRIAVPQLRRGRPPKPSPVSR